MKKYLYQFMVALFAISSFTLVACSDDDDDPTNNNGGNTIEINGTKYNVSPFVSMMGSWNETLKSGEFTISVDIERNGTIIVDYYSFKFENTTCPTVGDDVAQMDLVLTPLTENSDDPIWDSSYNYVSGKAVITNTNPSESEITIAFDNLNMSKDNNTYSFNGTVTSPFSYDGWYD